LFRGKFVRITKVIRSENADMSNDKSCEKQDRLKSKGSCAP